MHEQQCHKLTACDAQSPLLGHERAALLVEGGFFVAQKDKMDFCENLGYNIECNK